MQEAWERAVQLSLTFDKEKAPKIIQMVCRRLREIRRFEPAGEMYEQMG